MSEFYVNIKYKTLQNATLTSSSHLLKFEYEIIFSKKYFNDNSWGPILLHF